MNAVTPEAHYDLAIIGGGLVGASLAVLLSARAGDRDLRILLVEASDMHGQAPGGTSAADLDVRTTALSAGSRDIYEQAGLWPSVAAQAAPIRRVHVSDRGRLGAVRLDAGELGVEALGHVVANRDLGRALHTALSDCPAVELLSPARVQSLQPCPQGMRLIMAGDPARTLQASLVVMADGGRSGLCEQLGIGFRESHYQQQALVTNVAFSRPHAGVAYERFTEQGPLAVLPLPSRDGEHRGALIWTLPQAEAPDIAETGDAQFLQALQQRFGNRLGFFRRAGTRSLFPLALRQAREQIRPGLVLLGNVAHTLHPVAGQGLNLALRDVQSLAETVVRAVDAGRSPGEMRVLEHYLESRRSDQALTITFSDYMTWLFASRRLRQVWARKFALMSIDLLPPVKTRFARQTMGLADRQAPRLED